MARTVPTLFSAIPMHMTAEMRAYGAANVQTSLGITADRQFFHSMPNDAALAGLQIARRLELAWHQVFREILDGGYILADKIHRSGHGFSGRVVDIRPFPCAVDDNILQQNAGQRAMRHALAGVAGR